METYFETAHVKKEVSHRGKTLSSLHNDKSTRRDLTFVYHIMDFLVRATLSGREEVCKVKIARFFVEKLKPMEEQLGASKILKVWDRYRTAAAYIYAFYPRLYGADSQQGAFAEAKKITEEDGSAVLPSSPQNQPSRNVSGTQLLPPMCWRKQAPMTFELGTLKEYRALGHCCANLTPMSCSSSRAMTRRGRSNKYLSTVFRRGVLNKISAHCEFHTYAIRMAFLKHEFQTSTLTKNSSIARPLFLLFFWRSRALTPGSSLLICAFHFGSISFFARAIFSFL